MPDIVLLKLGGSLITDKARPETPRLEVISRLAGEIARAARDSPFRLIVGHGSGSFGHVAARQSGIASGLHSAEQLPGVSRTQERAAALHRLVIAALVEAGALPFSIAPSSCLVAAAGRPAAFAAEPLLLALDRGLLPVLYGDVVTDRAWGISICSTERLFETPGPHPCGAGADGPPRPLARRDRRPLRRRGQDRLQDPAGDLDRAAEAIGAPAGTDVTGGMLHRVETALALARLGIPSLLANGLVPGLLERALRGETCPAPKCFRGSAILSRVRAETEQREARMADLEQLLIATSRTFALAIPLLPEPTRREVTLSYLLFRVADTFEDAASWPRAAAHRGARPHSTRCWQSPGREEIAEVARRWAEEVPCEQLGYRELLAELPVVLDAFFALSPEAVELIREHVLRTSRGMAGFVARTTDDGELRLRDIAGPPGLLLRGGRHRRRAADRALPARPPAARAGRRRAARALARLRRGAPARQHPQGFGLGRHARAALPARRRRARRGDGARAPRSPGGAREYVLDPPGRRGRARAGRLRRPPRAPRHRHASTASSRPARAPSSPAPRSTPSSSA